MPPSDHQVRWNCNQATARDVDVTSGSSRSRPVQTLMGRPSFKVEGCEAGRSGLPAVRYDPRAGSGSTGDRQRADQTLGGGGVCCTTLVWACSVGPWTHPTLAESPSRRISSSLLLQTLYRSEPCLTISRSWRTHSQIHTSAHASPRRRHLLDTPHRLRQSGTLSRDREGIRLNHTRQRMMIIRAEGMWRMPEDLGEW